MRRTRSTSSRQRPRGLRLLLPALALAVLAPAAHAVVGDVVLSQTKVTLPGELGSGDFFGSSFAAVGDVDGAGGVEVAVGAPFDSDGGYHAGTVYLLFLDGAGGVGGTLKISEANDPNNAFQLGAYAQFGRAVAPLGDLDGDGDLEIAVGASEQGAGAPNNTGSVWILDLAPDTDVTPGLPLSGVRITSGDLVAGLDANDRFGESLASLGDWDGDGVPDLAVGAPGDDDDGTDNGAVYILYLNADGTLKSEQKISASSGGFGGGFDPPTEFGSALAAVGDQDGDGQTDLAVGAALRSTAGAVWLLFMDPGCQTLTVSPPNTNCVVKPAPDGFVEIREGSGGFGGSLGSNERFGRALAWLPSTSGYPPDRLAVGAPETPSGTLKGAVWLLAVADGALAGQQRIASEEGWDVVVDNIDRLGTGVGALGDIDGDGVPDLALGAPGDDDEASEAGAAYLALLSPCSEIVARPIVYHDPNQQGHNPCGAVAAPSDPTFPLYLYIESGAEASPGVKCADGAGGGDEMCAWDVRLLFDGAFTLQDFAPDPAIAAAARTNGPPYPSDELRVNWLAPDFANPPRGVVKIGNVTVANDGSGGAVRIDSASTAVGASLQLQPMAERTIALPEPGGALGLGAGALLLAALGRVRRRGSRKRRGRALARCLGAGVVVLGLAAGAPSRAVDSIESQSQVRLAPGQNGLPLNLVSFGGGKWLGRSLAALGDLDANGTQDLALGCCGHVLGGSGGRAFMTFLDEDGTALAPPDAILDEGPGGTDTGYIGGIALLEDRNGDGVRDLALGAVYNGGSFEDHFALVFLDRTGRETGSRVIIGDGVGSIPPGTIAINDGFGRALAPLGSDLDGHSATYEIAVGTPFDDGTSGNDAGAVWIISLDNVSNDVVKQQKIAWDDLGIVGGGAVNFGWSLAYLGDLDGAAGPSLGALAVGSPNFPRVDVLFLGPNGADGIQVLSHQGISGSEGGLSGSPARFGESLAWLGAIPVPPPANAGGVLAVGALSGLGEVHMLHLGSDAVVRSQYRIAQAEPHGATLTSSDSGFGSSLAAPGDIDGHGVRDLVVGAETAFTSGAGVDGAAFVFFMKDADFDGLDDALDNCIDIHNPLQADGDDDGVGDLCDNCEFVSNPANTVATDCNGDLDTTDPGEGVGEQCDVDNDGEGDVCEPVELQLQFQPTATLTEPAWDLRLQCGAYDVTDVEAGIVLPAGISGPMTLTLDGTSVGTNTISGPGLSSPKDANAIYFDIAGNGAPDNRLCTAIDAAIRLGTLACTSTPSSCAIGGTQLAAAALTPQGVTTLAEGCHLDGTPCGGAVPNSDLRLVNGIPAPILDLELGPAVVTGTCSGGGNDGGSCSVGGECPGGSCVLGTRWEVLLRNAGTEFHRVAFGLIAPFGTGTADMRWLGCASSAAPPGGRALVAGERSCTGGSGFGTTVNAATSWTVGPQASAPGTQLDHTLYVVLEGNRAGAGSDTLNPANGPTNLVLGAVELDGNPDLEPALTTDGANDLDDLFNTGTPVPPFEESVFNLRDPTEVRLIGAFNPADDVDDDGVQDLADNCPFAPNADQANRGSFLDATEDSDFLGDACQCAEATDDGAVLDPDDFDEIRDYLSGKITNPVIAAEIEKRCSVAGSTACNMRDLVFLKLAIDAGAPAVETRCDAALSPAQ